MSAQITRRLMLACPMLFTLSAAYTVWLVCVGRVEKGDGVRFRGRLRIGMELALSLLLAAAHFAIFPAREIYDDGGIILRYMDHFALGHFFAYNPADGPIYGVSGFVHGIVAGFLVLAGYAVVIWPELAWRIEAHTHHFNIIESERIAVGRWIHEASQPEDVVLTGHGHIARECRRRYVIDSSGLNSVLTTDLGRDIERIVKHAQPDWIAWADVLPAGVQRRGGYTLARSFYGISTAEATSASRAFRKGLPWRVYRRTASQRDRHDVHIEPGHITCDGTVETNGATHVRGTVARFGAGEIPLACEQFCMGIQRSDRNQELLVSVFDTDDEVSLRRELTVERVDRDDFADGYATTWRCELTDVPAVSRIEVRCVSEDSGNFVLIAPVLTGVER